jgi:hypothetical protein
MMAMNNNLRWGRAVQHDLGQGGSQTTYDPAYRNEKRDCPERTSQFHCACRPTETMLSGGQQTRRSRLPEAVDYLTVLS